MKMISETLNGQTFTMFLRHLNEFKATTKREEDLQPRLRIFIDKVANLTPSETINDLILRRLAGVNLDLMTSEKLMEHYQENSTEFKFEENIRREEIVKFSKTVVPESKFLFNNFPINTLEDQNAVKEPVEGEEIDTEPTERKVQENVDQFFQSHEKIGYKPETNFKSIRNFTKVLPVDFYVLFQANAEKA